jgi:hypothetical protein
MLSPTSSIALQLAWHFFDFGNALNAFACSVRGDVTVVGDHVVRVQGWRPASNLLRPRAFGSMRGTLRAGRLAIGYTG